MRRTVRLIVSLIFVLGLSTVCGCGKEAQYTLEANGNNRAAKLLETFIRDDDSLSGRKITLSVDGEHVGEDIQIIGGDVYLYGTDKEDLQKTVCTFANMYLGYAFAGTDRECLLEKANDTTIPDNTFSVETPWVEERETIICLWKTNAARGQFFNNAASLKSEILTYTDEQLYQYVKMMKYFGFTGIQVTDMCSAWAQYSGYEFVHERLRFMADAAHSLDMKFTLWVWGAEFDGYGWYDDSIVYNDYANYGYSFESPEAYATFNKYYDIYAELADCSDRVIMHFDDPSNIHDSVEIATYAKLFKDKVTAVNPDINFGVSDYTDKYDKKVFAEYLGDDITIYSGAKTYDALTWVNFRTVVRDLGTDYGVWSWNLGEMEIDQLAEMNVNAKLIKNVYEATASEDYVIKPSYWSEMDSYHIANIFSLYCEGRLLQDISLDPDELLHEVARDLVGEQYADSLAEILNIIQDARTGDSWGEFKWNFSDDYLLRSDVYPAEDIYARCLDSEEKLSEMIRADLQRSVIPLPVSVSDVLEIVRTHIKQIEAFAKFRMDFDSIKADYYEGASKEETVTAIEAISAPVPNYNALIGAWGQPEALAQFVLIQEFANEIGLEIKDNPQYMNTLKQLIYSEIRTYQKLEDKQLVYDYENASLWPYIIGREATGRVIEELLEDGILIRADETRVYLTDYEDYLEIY